MILTLLQLATPVILWVIDKFISGDKKKIQAKKEWLGFIEARRNAHKGPSEARKQSQDQKEAFETPKKNG